MKLPVRYTPAACVRNGASRSGEAGSALLVVFILLTLMVTFVVSQSLTLHYLKRELRLIERRQLQRYEAVAGANAPARLQNGQAQLRPGTTNTKQEP
ncbi:MAG: hypothetical protein AAB466_11660 [Verrucomicrobiota bacterium]